jgi:hypothetical protein
MTTTPPKLPSMFAQLLSASASAAQAKAEAERPPWPPNPFPSGIRSGSATEAVLNLLRSEAPRHLEHGQIRMRLDISRGMATWALKYLEGNGMVERVHDPRHPHYRRWRVTQKGLNHDNG